MTFICLPASHNFCSPLRSLGQSGSRGLWPWFVISHKSVQSIKQLEEFTPPVVAFNSQKILWSHIISTLQMIMLKLKAVVAFPS